MTLLVRSLHTSHRVMAGGSPVASVRILLAAAAMPRFRAEARRHIRTSARYLMWIVGVGTVADSVWLLPTHIAQLPRIGAAGAISVGIAFLAYRLLVRSRHANAERLIFAILIAIDVAAAITGQVDVEMAMMVAGYMLLMPLVVALLIPWNTRIHLAWLVVHVVLVGLMATFEPVTASALGGPKSLIGVLLLASAISIVGHLSNLRGRVASFALIEQIRSMNRTARRDDVRLRRLNVLLEEMAHRDELTGLGNRAALRDRLAAVRSRIDRLGTCYGLLMLDIDHFKAINDRLGHFAGDDVLRRVAEAIHAATRAADGAFRFGGEEFIAIVELAGPDAVTVVAERIRRAVEALGINHPANGAFANVTVSIGGCVVDRRRLGAPDEAWFQAADAALYVAKRQGRNRTVIAGDTPKGY